MSAIIPIIVFKRGMCIRYMALAMTKIANRIHLLYFLCRKKYIVMKTNAVLWNRNPSRLMAKNGIGLRFCRYSMELINSRMDRLLRIRSVLSTIPLKLRNITKANGRLSVYLVKKRVIRMVLITQQTKTKN